MALIGQAGYRPERDMGDAFTARSKPVPYKYGWQATMAGIRNLVANMATPKPPPPPAQVPVYYDYDAFPGSPDAATYPRSIGVKPVPGFEPIRPGQPSPGIGDGPSVENNDFAYRAGQSIVDSASRNPFDVPPAPSRKYAPDYPYPVNPGIEGPGMSVAGKRARPSRPQPTVTQDEPFVFIDNQPGLSVAGKPSSMPLAPTQMPQEPFGYIDNQPGMSAANRFVGSPAPYYLPSDYAPQALPSIADMMPMLSAAGKKSSKKPMPREPFPMPSKPMAYAMPEERPYYGPTSSRPYGPVSREEQIVRRTQAASPMSPWYPYSVYGYTR